MFRLNQVLLFSLGISSFVACQGAEGTGGEGGPDGVSVGDGDGDVPVGDGDGDLTGTGSTTGDGDASNFVCDVATVLTERCGACHGGEVTFADLDLISPELEGRLVDVPSVSCPSWMLVVPGSPERSVLYQKVASDTPPCGDRMPVKEVLSDPEIACIADFIRGLAGDQPVETCETCGGTTCVDVETDVNHCGACGEACTGGEQCVAGVCEACQGATESCGGSCVDLLTDSGHCGACGVACGGGQTCVEGTCSCSESGLSVSFASDIQPILTDTCATNGCHAAMGGMAPGGKPTGAGPGDVSSDLVLEASVSYDMLVGQTSGCDGLSYVEPGDVSASYLMNKLTGSGMCGGTKMPKGGAPLTQEQLDLIGNWICAGAEDN